MDTSLDQSSRPQGRPTPPRERLRRTPIGHAVLRSGNGDDSPVASRLRHGSRYDAALAGRPDGEPTDRLAVVRFRDLG